MDDQTVLHGVDTTSVGVNGEEREISALTLASGEEHVISGHGSSI